MDRHRRESIQNSFEKHTVVWWNIDPRQRALIKIDGFIIVYYWMIMKELCRRQVVVDFLLSVEMDWKRLKAFVEFFTQRQDIYYTLVK